MTITCCDICQSRVEIAPETLREVKTAAYSGALLLSVATLQVQVQVRRADGPMPDLCGECLAEIVRDAFPSSRAVPA